MGRWGYRIFEGDVDCDLKIELTDMINKKYNVEMKDIDIIQDQEEEKAAIIYARETLDKDDLGTKVFEDLIRESFESTRNMPKDEAEWIREENDYKLIIYGAIMMECGAKLTSNQRAYLLRLARKAPGHEAYQFPIFDHGFRRVGKLQYIAAVENYKDGTPRDFKGQLCFGCGKITEDLIEHPNPPLANGSEDQGLDCGGDCYASWCSTKCQYEDKDFHDAICRKKVREQSNGGIMWLNV